MWPFKTKVKTKRKTKEELQAECDVDNEPIPWKSLTHNGEFDFFKEYRTEWGIYEDFITDGLWKKSKFDTFRCGITKNQCSRNGDCRYCRIAFMGDERNFGLTMLGYKR